MKNQTESSWLTGVSPSDPGTGVFVTFADLPPNIGPISWQEQIPSTSLASATKFLLQTITYPECVRKAYEAQVVAFKWVPESLASFDVVKAQAKSCIPVMCVDRCARFGCVCTGGECK